MRNFAGVLFPSLQLDTRSIGGDCFEEIETLYLSLSAFRMDSGHGTFLLLQEQ